MTPLRARLEALIERAIDLLAALDGDPDLEGVDEREPDAGELCAWRSGEVDQRLSYQPSLFAGLMYDAPYDDAVAPRERRSASRVREEA